MSRYYRSRSNDILQMICGIILLLSPIFIAIPLYQCYLEEKWWRELPQRIERLKQEQRMYPKPD